MHEIATHMIPWYGVSEEDTCSRVAEGERLLLTTKQQLDCPDGWVSLMERCWSQEPTARLPFSVILNELNAMQETVTHQTIDDSLHNESSGAGFQYLELSMDGLQASTEGPIDMDMYYSLES